MDTKCEMCNGKGQVVEKGRLVDCECTIEASEEVADTLATGLKKILNGGLSILESLAADEDEYDDE